MLLDRRVKAMDLGHWHRRADATGSDPHSPSGVIVDAEKVKPCMLAARKTLHQKP